MKYVPVGQTGVHASILALGAMTFGEKNPWKLGGLDQLTVDKMVKHAIDVGINFFDTADVYSEGDSEKTLGKALKPYREQVLIATKVRAKTGTGVNEIGLSRHHVKRGIQHSLENLDTKWSDFYKLHFWDWHVAVTRAVGPSQDMM